MLTIESTLARFFQQYPNKDIVVAYSGGIDSQVLLYALAQLAKQNILSNKISICHVNHGLSENALTWQLFAKQQAQQLGLPIEVCEVNVVPQKQHSLEELARDARYKALQESSVDHALIVTGHHSDDQSETFLLAIKRGAGLKGLSAMKTIMPLGKQILVRPLLNISRQMIMDYANKHQLSWIEDESNQDSRFDRNFIRHNIMPVLTERWPSMLTTIARSALHCQEAESLLRELAAQDLKFCQISQTSLSVEEIKKLSKARFNNLIRYFLQNHQCLMPSTEQLEQVHNQLSAAADKIPAVKVGHSWLRRFKGELYLTADFDDVSSWVYEIDVQRELYLQQIQLPDKLGVLIVNAEFIDTDIDNFDNGVITQHQVIPPNRGQKVMIKFSHRNPKCLPDYRQHSRSLKKVLQELSIAPWLRQRLPFLYYDEQLVGVIGHFICKPFIPEKGEPALNIRWTK
ncbi:MAG: tRNA lysidine(34) synthetase TilS [Colwellia sp.]|nr:tRNA lysidine(34) synthetase TilS [Colwellia sp.]